MDPHILRAGIILALVCFVALILGCGSLRYNKPVGYDDDQPVPKNFDRNVAYKGWPETAEQWHHRRARKLIGERITVIDVRGCMADDRSHVVREGRCCFVFNTIDYFSGKPIWQVHCRTDQDEPFSVLAARCWWQSDTGRWEESI